MKTERRTVAFGRIAIMAVSVWGVTIIGAAAAPYAWTNTASVTSAWSTAANWTNASAPPSGGASTVAVVLFKDITTALPNSAAIVSTNDLGAGSPLHFDLTNLTLNGKGPASGAGTVTILGADLNLTNNGATLPTVNLNAAGGTAGLTYNVNCAVNLVTDTVFQATSGTPVYNFASIGGAGRLTVSNVGTLKLTGNNTNFTGKISIVNGGTNPNLELNSDGSLGAVPGSFVPNAITIDNGSILQFDTVMTVSSNRGITFGAAGGILRANVPLGALVTVAGPLAGNGGVTIRSGGTVGSILALTGSNTFTGTTMLNTASLQADDNVGLPGLLSPGGGANLTFNGALTTCPVLENNLSTTFTRALGTGQGQVQWSATGFAAKGAKLTVNLGGSTPNPIVWGGSGASAAFVRDGYTLCLGCANADNEVEFQNNIDLNGQQRTIRSEDNGGSANDVGTISGVLSGTTGSGIYKTGTGVIVLKGANTYAGATRVGYDTLRLGANNAIPVDSDVSVKQYAAGTVTLDLNGFDQTLNKPLVFGCDSGAAAAISVLTGAGTLTLNGGLVYDTNNNPGGVTMTGKISLGNATRTFNIGDSTAASATPNDVAISAVISGDPGVGLVKAGAGTLALSGGNTFSGNLTITGGVVSITDDTSLGAVPGSAVANSIILDGATLGIINNTVTISANRGITLGAGGGIISCGLMGGGVSYGGTITGSGRLTISTKSCPITLTGMNTHSGGTTFIANQGNSGDTLTLYSDAALGAVPASVVADNIILSVSAGTPYIIPGASFAISPNRGMTLQGGLLELYGVAGINLFYDNVITGGAGSTVLIEGAPILRGMNTYQGITEMRGTVVVTSLSDIGQPGALGAPAEANATIQLGTGNSGGGLKYAGTAPAGHSTNRKLWLHPSSSLGSLDASGVGPMMFTDTSTNFFTTPNTQTAGFTLTGSGVGSIAGGMMFTNVGASYRLTKSGTGLWMLGGSNIYNTTNVNGTVIRVTAGTLQFNNVGALPTGTVSISVSAGATAAAGYPGGMDQTFLGKIQTASAGMLALACDSAMPPV